jgi:hypothetical protein
MIENNVEVTYIVLGSYHCCFVLFCTFFFFFFFALAIFYSKSGQLKGAPPPFCHKGLYFFNFFFLNINKAYETYMC